MGVALAGIAVGWFVYRSGQIDWVALRDRLRPLHRTFESGFFFDTIYGALIATPGKAVAAFLAYVFDQRVIDGAVSWIGRGTTALAAVGRKAQTGLVRTYALAFLVGVVAILWYVAARI